MADSFKLVGSPPTVRGWGTMSDDDDLNAKVRGRQSDGRGAEKGAVHGLLPIVNPVGRHKDCPDGAGAEARGDPRGVGPTVTESVGKDFHAEKAWHVREL